MKKLIVILFALSLLSTPLYAVEYDANADGKIDATYLPIGTSIQAYDPDLVAIAALTCTENQIIKRNGSGAWVCADDSASMTYPGAGIAKSTGSAWDTSYAIGTGAGSIAAGDHAHSGTYEPTDSDLTAIAALACTENQIIKRNGSGAWVCAADAAGGDVATDTIFDAAGDLVQGTGSNTSAKLTKGAEGTILRAGATSNAYSTSTFADTYAAGTLLGAASSNAVAGVTTISLDDSAAQFYNTAAPTKLVKVDASGLTAGETAVIKPVGNYTLTYTLTGNSGVTYPTSGTLATVKAEKLAVFSWDGGGSALSASAGTKRCAFVPSAATLTGLYFSTGAESTSDITVALYKDAFAAGAHATTAMISGTNAVTIPAAGTVLNINDTTLTNFTKTISAGDQVCAEITATDTTTWLQITLYGTK